MMTNEQRAHDIAIALLPTSMQKDIGEAIANKDEEINIDAFTHYKALYYVALEACQKEFGE